MWGVLLAWFPLLKGDAELNMQKQGTHFEVFFFDYFSSQWNMYSIFLKAHALSIIQVNLGS